jgi:hypothetical protein
LAEGGDRNEAGTPTMILRQRNILLFHASMPEKEAVDGAATHLRRYWTTKMIRALIAYADEGHASLNATAGGAIETLKQAASPA